MHRNPYGKAPMYFLHLDGIASKLAHISGSSEYIKGLYAGEEAIGAIMTDLNLNKVTEGQIERARRQIYKYSQMSLKARGLPSKFNVYRSGTIPHLVGYEFLASVSLSRLVVDKPYYAQGGIFQYTVNRADVLCNMEAIIAPSQQYMESELLVPSSKLMDKVQLS